jgi:hypothetical protein
MGARIPAGVLGTAGAVGQEYKFTRMGYKTIREAAGASNLKTELLKAQHYWNRS